MREKEKFLGFMRNKKVAQAFAINLKLELGYLMEMTEIFQQRMF